jgi:eukaryotic-like serine/threonine-protein kinase
MTFRDRMQWIFRMALLSFILTSVAFLSAITAMRFAIQGREVSVPDVVGKKSGEAQGILQGRGLGMKIEDRLYNAAPADTIVRQSPASGSRVKIGQFDHVVVSLGPQKATIPALTDRSIRAARIELLRSGLQAGEISSVYLAGSEDDAVLQQDPAPGTSDVTSPHVDMLVSLGPRPVAFVMPDVMGLNLVDAEQRLSASGLHIGKISVEPAPGALHGTVLAQSPLHGARVELGSPIDLQVAE